MILTGRISVLNQIQPTACKFGGAAVFSKPRVHAERNSHREKSPGITKREQLERFWQSLPVRQRGKTIITFKMEVLHFRIARAWIKVARDMDGSN